MIRYVVNEEKRTVTAILTGCECDAHQIIVKRHMTFKDCFADEDSILLGRALMADKIVAVAKCHPDDTFYEEAGKQVAREKLNKKYRKELVRAMKNWEKYQFIMIREVMKGYTEDVWVN